MYQWCRISFINSRLNMIKTHPHLYLGPFQCFSFFLKNFQHLGGSNTTDVNRTMDIRWVLGAVTDGARDLCKSSRYCEILIKNARNKLNHYPQILFDPLFSMEHLSLSLTFCGFALFGYHSTRSVGSFLWEACLFQPWRNRHGQS